VLHAQCTSALSFGFLILQGNAEALHMRGGKTKHILISYFLSNTFAKTYRNWIVYVKIIASQMWDVFWDTVYIHFRGFLPPNGILPGRKFILRPSLAYSYIGSVSARHSSSGCQPNFAACYKEWNYGTFAEGVTYIRLGGHHVGHRNTL